MENLSFIRKVELETARKTEFIFIVAFTVVFAIFIIIILIIIIIIIVIIIIIIIVVIIFILLLLLSALLHLFPPSRVKKQSTSDF